MADISRRWSPYTYANNNPIRFIDPDGMTSSEFLSSWMDRKAAEDVHRGENQTSEDAYNRIQGLQGMVAKEQEKKENAEYWNNFAAENFGTTPSTTNDKTTNSDPKEQTTGGKALRILGSFGAVDKNKTFMGKVLQVISHFTWELPQQVVGVLTAEVTNVLGGIKSVHSQNGALVLESKWMGGGVGFTLGNLLTVGAGSDARTVSHEYGHYIQSRRFGVGYLFGFAIPSVIRAGLWGMGIVGGEYDSFYTEKNATKLGKKYWQ